MSDGKDDKTRINRVITRSGDDGRTGLADGSRIAKDHPRIQALGALDELNSGLGVLRARALDDDLVEVESQADMLNAELAPLKEFVLPGGHPDAAWCHHCRTVARRAERDLIAVGDDDQVNPVSRAVLNRVGDLLFVMARAINLRTGTDEPQWVRRQDR